MKIYQVAIFLLIGLCSLPTSSTKASPLSDSKPQLQFAFDAPFRSETNAWVPTKQLFTYGESGSVAIVNKNWHGKKKRKRKRRRRSPDFLGAGVVFGGATGLGGRVVMKPGIVALAFDASMDRVKTEDGTRVWSSVMKLDGRLYGRGLLDQLVHPYLFAGAAMQRGRFEGEEASTAWLGDIGLGAELKFGRLGVNGEVGLLVPVKSAINFRPGLDFYGGVALMWWLL